MMRTTGWKADEPPRVRWTIGAAQFPGKDPEGICQFSAEVELPNGQVAIVEDIRVEKNTPRDECGSYTTYTFSGVLVAYKGAF